MKCGQIRMKLKDWLEATNDVAWTRVVPWMEEKWVNLEYVSVVALTRIAQVWNVGN